MICGHFLARFPEAVYVLHAFQKKSKKGIATPKFVMDVVKHRLAAARRDHQTARGKHGKR